MKTYLPLIIGLFLFSFSNKAVAQYEGCPNQGSDVTGHLNVRLKNPTTGAIYVGAPQPNTVYQLEIYETPFNPAPPTYRRYQVVGVQGTIDGFRLYSDVGQAQNNPNGYISDSEITQGTGRDVGTSSGVAVFGIKTLPASDPNWSGQLTFFKAFGLCYPNSVQGLPNKYFKKTLAILP